MIIHRSFPAHTSADLRGVKRLKEAKIGAFLDVATCVHAIPVKLYSLALPRGRYIRRRVQGSVSPATALSSHC